MFALPWMNEIGFPKSGYLKIHYRSSIPGEIGGPFNIELGPRSSYVTILSLFTYPNLVVIPLKTIAMGPNSHIVHLGIL
jgi:hypothetical protein